MAVASPGVLDGVRSAYTRRRVTGRGAATFEAALAALGAVYQMPRGNNTRWMKIDPDGDGGEHRFVIAHTRGRSGGIGLGGVELAVEATVDSGAHEPLVLSGITRPTAGLIAHALLSLVAFVAAVAYVVARGSVVFALLGVALIVVQVMGTRAAIGDVRALISDLATAIDGPVTYVDERDTDSNPFTS